MPVAKPKPENRKISVITDDLLHFSATGTTVATTTAGNGDPTAVVQVTDADDNLAGIFYNVKAVFFDDVVTLVQEED